MTKAQADTGPPERHQHDTLVSRETEQAGVVGARVVMSGHLNRYLGRGLLGGAGIKDRRHEAGRKLGEDFQLAGLEPRVTSRMSDYVSNGSVPGYVPLSLDAYKRYQIAIKSLPAGCRAVVDAVCCYDEKAGDAIRMELLRIGLDSLIRTYGIR